MSEWGKCEECGSYLESDGCCLACWDAADVIAAENSRRVRTLGTALVLAAVSALVVLACL